MIPRGLLLGGLPDQRREIACPRSRLTVREQQDTVQRLRGLDRGHLSARGCQAIIEVCGVAGNNAVDVVFNQGLVADTPCRHDHVGILFKRHHAEDVFRLQQVDHIGAGAFGIIERLALHRPGAVDDQRDIERQTRRLS